MVDELSRYWNGGPFARYKSSNWHKAHKPTDTLGATSDMKGDVIRSVISHNSVVVNFMVMYVLPKF